jgi:hypothetical protein
MNSNHPLDVSLRDLLTEVTRKERRMLLGVSVLAIFVARTGLVPSKISALGVDFELAQQQAFLWMFPPVVGYFLFAFVLYGAADFIAWRIAYNEGSKENFKKLLEGVLPKTAKDAATSEYVPEGWVSVWPNHMARPVSILRAMFEFLLPVCVGLYAVYAVYARISTK